MDFMKDKNNKDTRVLSDTRFTGLNSNNRLFANIIGTWKLGRTQKIHDLSAASAIQILFTEIEAHDPHRWGGCEDHGHTD